MSKRFVESVGAGSLQASEDGTFPIALITPGQGSSAYYTEEVIRTYAPAALPKGTHVYLDHLKEGESRSPEKLLGYLTEDTTVDEEGRAVNRFKPLKKHREWIEDIAPLVGFSISVRGTGSEGEIDGKKTLIAESLEPHVTNTVDIVSYAGRGGKFLESYLEVANQHDRTPSDEEAGSMEGNESMTDEQMEKLAQSISAALAPKLEAIEGLLTPAEVENDDAEKDRVAAIEAVRAVESADVSDETKASLIEGIKRGNYDVQAEIEKEQRLRESIRAELAEKLGGGAGAGILKESHNDDDYNVKGWGK